MPSNAIFDRFVLPKEVIMWSAELRESLLILVFRRPYIDDAAQTRNKRMVTKPQTSEYSTKKVYYINRR